MNAQGPPDSTDPADHEATLLEILRADRDTSLLELLHGEPEQEQD